MRFSTDELARLRSGIMTRGQTLSTILAAILAGKHHPSIDAMLTAHPGLRPEEAVRMTLEQVEGRRRLIDTNDDAYGRCDVCHADLGLAVLGEMPWADRCRAHVAD